MLEPTSGTLILVCKNSTVYMARLSFVSHHLVTQIRTCTTSTWRHTSCCWPIGCTKMPPRDTRDDWLSTPAKTPSQCSSTVKVSSATPTPASWPTPRWRSSRWHPADATDSVWSTHFRLCVPPRSPLKVSSALNNARLRILIILLHSEGHGLTVIATDGEPVHPVNVNTVISFSGMLIANWKLLETIV